MNIRNGANYGNLCGEGQICNFDKIGG